MLEDSHRSDGSIFKPVSFVQPILSLADKQLPAHNAFFAPSERGIIARAGSAKVHISRSAAAFIVNSGRDVAIMSLHDSPTRDVSMNIAGHDIKLRAGEMVVITSSHTLPFDRVNPLPGVAIRHMVEHTLTDGSRAFVCEFSIISAMSQLGTLRDLKQSTSAHHQATYTNMPKNAAAPHSH